MISQAMLSELPTEVKVSKPTGGLSAELNEKKITFWYKRNKVHYSRENLWELFKPGEELQLIKKYLIEPAEKVSKSCVITKKYEDKGTQACIDHLARKIETIEISGRDTVKTALVLMLKNLQLEFEQYL